MSDNPGSAPGAPAVRDRSAEWGETTRSGTAPDPAPAQLPPGLPIAPAPPLSRSARRLAAQNEGRRRRLRRSLEITAALLIGVLVVCVVRLLTGSGAAGRQPSAAPPAVGANLADPGLASAYLSGTASDLAVVTTYDYRHLDDALANGLAVTTGAYRRAYRAAMTGDLARAARAHHVVHSFELLDLGIGTMSSDGTLAKVLVFGRQRVTDDRTGSGAQVLPMTLCATVRREGNRYRIGDLVEGADPGLPPGGPDLPVAAEAARSEVVNMLSLRRESFDADLRRALAGATGPLREQLDGTAGHIRQAMTKGNYDTVAAVRASAVVRAGGRSVTFLVAADGERLSDGAPPAAVTEYRYVVTVTRTATGWAANRIASVEGDN